MTARALSTFPAQPETLVAVRFHIDLKMIPVIESLSEKVRLLVFPCHKDTTDHSGWNYLVKRATAQLEPEWAPHILDKELKAHANSFLCDLGGDMICWAAASQNRVNAAMEGTTTGIKQIADLASEIPFPVLDWNGAVLKQSIHNEKMVGFSIWQTFTEVTRLSLHGKTVGVLGFGLVGRGIARQARALGGCVLVYEPNGERRILASYEGFACPQRNEVLSCDVLVSATGRSEALTGDDVQHLKDGAFLLNAGHSESEIAAAVRDHPNREAVLESVEKVRLDNGRHLYLLARGRLLNLAAGFGDTINAFDLTSALLVKTLSELLTSWGDYSAGLSPSSSTLDS